MQAKLITPLNDDLLLGFFKFLSEVNYSRADEYLSSTLFKALKILATYKLSGYEDATLMQLHLYSNISNYIVKILYNTYLSANTHNMIINYMMNKSNQYSLYNLIKSAINNQIYTDSELG